MSKPPAERDVDLDRSKYCADCGQSFEFLGGEGRVERSGQCEVCAGERDCDDLRTRIKNAEAGSVIAKAFIDRLAAENDRQRVALTNLIAAAEWLLDDCETSDMRQYAVDAIAIAAARIAKARP